MPNWLVKREEDEGEGHYGPNISPLGHARRRTEGAKSAERQSVQARRHGEKFYAYMRQEDAREHRQRRWDWGDWSTWAILFGLTAIGLIIAISAYLLPWGQHMAPPPIKVC